MWKYNKFKGAVKKQKIALNNYNNFFDFMYIQFWTNENYVWLPIFRVYDCVFLLFCFVVVALKTCMYDIFKRTNSSALKSLRNVIILCSHRHSVYMWMYICVQVFKLNTIIMKRHFRFHCFIFCATVHSVILNTNRYKNGERKLIYCINVIVTIRQRLGSVLDKLVQFFKLCI